ncbi:MAG: hypothetical protein PWR12_957 [Eubacteriaceae bacterium]|nr:hypothetical protein [Eubacteriaceae bacterium]
MNNHYHKNRSIMIMGILITLIWLALSVFVNRIYDKRMEEYLDHQDEMFTNGIESIINTYSSYAEFIYQSILNTPEIRAIMSEAQSADQESKALLREELYQELIETYDLLTEHDFRHLQFHMANGESFLRLHKPERYGDSLISVRESIRYVTTEHSLFPVLKKDGFPMAIAMFFLCLMAKILLAVWNYRYHRQQLSKNSII